MTTSRETLPARISSGCRRRVIAPARLAVSSAPHSGFRPPFSVAAIAVTRQLKLNPETVNVNGGAVALGHPIGASGARILVTLLYELQRRNLKRGVAALCLGGGNAVALAVERF